MVKTPEKCIKMLGDSAARFWSICKIVAATELCKFLVLFVSLTI
jgi:hypothetical protein